MSGCVSRGASFAVLSLFVACSTDESSTKGAVTPGDAAPEDGSRGSEPEPAPEPQPAPEPDAPEPDARPEPEARPEGGAGGDDGPPSGGGTGNGNGGTSGQPSGDGGRVNGGSGGPAEPEPEPESAAFPGDAGNPTQSGDASVPVEPEPVPPGEPVAVAVGYGMRRVSSRNGLDWEYFEESTPDGGDDNDLFRGLTFGGGRFVAVGGSSTSISMVSSDGMTWDPEDRGLGAWLGGVAFLNGEFVAAGGNGARVHSEDLGATWIEPVGSQAVHYRDVAAGGGLVVAVGHTYNGDPDVGVITVTSDGREWEEVGHSGDNLARVAFGNGAFVATGSNGRVSTSRDGRQWDDGVMGSGGNHVVFANDEFVLSNDDGVFRSIDGAEWTPVEGATSSVAGYIAGYYLGLDWPARIRASEDMVNWTVVFDPGGSGFTRVVTGYVE